MANAGPSEIIEEIRAWVDERFRSLESAIDYQKIEEIIAQLKRLQIPVSEEMKSKKATLESSLDTSAEGEDQLTFLAKELSSLAKDINRRLRDIRSQRTAMARKAPPKRLRVELPDGTVICENKATDTFVRVLHRIGLERVSELPIKLSGCPLVSTRRYESARAVRKLDGYFIATHSSTEGKAACVQQIVKELDIKITVGVLDE